LILKQINFHLSSKNQILLVVALSTVALLWWLFAKPSYNVVVRTPGMDDRPPMQPISDSIWIGQYFESIGVMDEIVAGEWTRFRGADFDNISKDLTPLADEWDESGPPVVWQLALGEGYAGPVVYNGRVYVLDYNERRKADMLRCFSLKTGEEIWRRWYNVEFKRNHGYSRTIPAITEDYIVTIGPRSHVMCVNPLDGSLLWTIDLEREYGVPGSARGKITPEFYVGQCPLIDNGVAVFAPGAKAIMIGVDCKTGDILWQTPNPDSLRMSHSSIIPMTIHGKKTYVYAALGGVVGVSAEGADIGKVLWQTKEWSPSMTVASPLYLGNGEILAFGSYGTGTARLAVSRDASGNFSVKVTERYRPSEGLASEQHTPIIVDDNIWAVLPENAGVNKRQLVCYKKNDLANPVWLSSREDGRYGKGMGPYIMSGNKLYLLDDEGGLFLFKIENTSATLLASHKLFDAIEAWSPMALAGKYLIVRDANNMLCLDISKKIN
jgi:outer membrane protein assembly factor BamB